ncbi:hypothetical protein [Thioalkalivibrio sp. ALE9]|uniref:hypothetical protein n=1 Tax=Thioalkalivibrio sp. ALE9 TaxID=1158169 RepID=UPI000364A885|nr:hypothetical protein [Thioalkalivibrio sp. ALE9]
MTQDERLDALEKMALDQGQELMAMDILLRSLVATSSDHQTLERVLQTVADNTVHQIRDHGFETGRSPQSARGLEAGVRKHIDRWLGILRQDG